MKKLSLILLLITSQVFAQKSNIESAVIYMRNSEFEDAKKAIDEAAVNPTTKDDPKMWSVRAAVYDSIVHNTEAAKLDSEKEEKFIVACLKCMETDTKKRFEEYCGTAILNSGFSAFNKAIEYAQASDVKNAVRLYDYVLKAIPYDKDGLFKKNGITEKIIVKGIGDMSYMAKDYQGAIANYKKLIGMGFMDAAVFRFATYACLLLNDTNQAVQFIDQGRKEFPANTDLINIELNIYLAQGRQNILINKLNEAIATDDENYIFHFVRGNIYDNMTKECGAKYGYDLDTIAKISKRAKTEANAGMKAKLNAAIRKLTIESDSILKATSQLSALAEADYKKVLEINFDYLDAQFNMGALYNNRASVIADKMNNISAANQTEYDKKWGVLKKSQDSVLKVSVNYFLKAQELAENLPEGDDQKKAYKKETLGSIYYSLQLVYANLGDEKTTIQYMKKRKELENQ